MTLKEACRVVFKNSISPATLKAEERRGNLRIAKIGRAYFVTWRDIALMIKGCRLESVRPASNKQAVERGDQAMIQAAVISARQVAEKLKATRKKR